MLHGIRQTMLIPVDLFHTSEMLWEIIRFWRNDRNLTKNISRECIKRFISSTASRMYQLKRTSIPVCWFDEAEFA
jgi:hypothetical protein